MKKMNWYWFSYSLKGKNQGVCIVDADSMEAAILKTIDLTLQPIFDDAIVQCVPVNKIPKSKLPLKPYKLYSSEEMSKLGYISVSYQK